MSMELRPRLSTRRQFGTALPTKRWEKLIGLNREELSATPHTWLVGSSPGTVTGAGPVRDFVAVTEFR